MLHAAAMIAGFFLIAFLLAHGSGARDGAVLAFAAALGSVTWAARFGGIRNNPFSSAPGLVALFSARWRVMLRGVLSTMRAALSADVTLKPALVRVRTGDSDGLAQAAVAGAISAVPGSMVVEAGRENMLVHVLDEDAFDGDALTRLYQRTMSLFGRSS